MLDSGNRHGADELLITALKKNDPKRKFAARILGKLGDKRAIEPLLEVVKGSGWGTKAALEALIDLGVSWRDRQSACPAGRTGRGGPFHGRYRHGGCSDRRAAARSRRPR